MTKVDRARRAIEILEEKYGNPKTALEYSNEFELLIAIILSAQCTDKRVNIVTKKLFKELPDALSFSTSSIDKIERLIFSTGFYKNKAKNILSCSKRIQELGYIPKTMKDLIKLSGVGRKTANVFMSEFHGIAEGVVVDTHIFRVSRRLGLSTNSHPESVERDLMKVLPKSLWIKYPNLVIWHGRDICSSRRPKCQICPLADICKSANKFNTKVKKIKS